MDHAHLLNLKRSESSARYPADQLLGLLGQGLITAHAPEATRLMEHIRQSKRFFVPAKDLWTDKTEAEFLHLLLDPLSETSDPLQRIEAVLLHLIQSAQQEPPASEHHEEEGEEADSSTRLRRALVL